MNHFARKANGKPSFLIDVMIKALDEAPEVRLPGQAQADTLHLDMGTFGSVWSNGVCFGCAATFTLMSLENLTPKVAASAHTSGLQGINTWELNAFERSMDELRQGRPHTLFIEIFKIPLPYIQFIVFNWDLRYIDNQEDWEKGRDIYVRFSQYLKTFNL